MGLFGSAPAAWRWGVEGWMQSNRSALPLPRSVPLPPCPALTNWPDLVSTGVPYPSSSLGQLQLPVSAQLTRTCFTAYIGPRGRRGVCWIALWERQRLKGISATTSLKCLPLSSGTIKLIFVVVVDCGIRRKPYTTKSANSRATWRLSGPQHCKTYCVNPAFSCPSWGWKKGLYCHCLHYFCMIHLNKCAWFCLCFYLTESVLLLLSWMRGTDAPQMACYTELPWYLVAEVILPTGTMMWASHLPTLLLTSTVTWKTEFSHYEKKMARCSNTFARLCTSLSTKG